MDILITDSVVFSLLPESDTQYGSNGMVTTGECMYVYEHLSALYF